MKNVQHEVYSHVVAGQSLANLVIQHLIYFSLWFVVDPLPDDEWEIQVKVANKDLFTAILRGAA